MLCLLRCGQRDHDARARATTARYRDLSAPGVDQASADGEPESTPARARGEVRLEDLRQHVVGNADAIVADDDLHTTIGANDVDVDVSRLREAGVLEDVQQYFAELVTARDRDGAVVGAGNAPRDLILAHSLQLDDVAHDLRNIDRRARRPFCRRRAVTTERARDLVEPIDLRQNPAHVLVQHTLVIHAPIAMRALQMLDAEADWRERILDLVCHLACHLAPREHALRPRELGHVVEREHGAGASPKPGQPAVDLSAVQLEVELLLVAAAFVFHERAHTPRYFGARHAFQRRAGRKWFLEQRIRLGIRYRHLG